jgi:ADP-ribosylglycohydrolase
MARKQAGKQEIRSEIVRRFGYDLGRSVESIRPDYQMSVSCQGSVPESIIAFLDADSYEDSLRNAISLGGDADTMACIAGGIAEAFHGRLPPEITRFCRKLLPQPLLDIVDRFRETYRIDT